MSDTPRTDAKTDHGGNVPCEFAGGLEREVAALRAQLTAGPDKVLRCAFCGEPYPEGTPTHKHEALVAHIRVCPEHPIGKENAALRAENDRLQRAYVRPDDIRAQLETAQSELAAKDALLYKYRCATRENVISARIIAAENAQQRHNHGIARDSRFIEERSNAVLALTPENIGGAMAQAGIKHYRLQHLGLRINEYLESGGLFNPEMALHDRVRDLLIEIRDAIKAP